MEGIFVDILITATVGRVFPARGAGVASVAVAGVAVWWRWVRGRMGISGILI
jgi:hypothetical protein